MLEGCVEACPGCQHRSLSRAESEGRKQDWLRERLAAAIGDSADRLSEIRGAPDSFRWGYRDKVCLRAEWNPTNENWKLGLRITKRRYPKPLYEVIDIPSCPVHTERVRAVHRVLSRELPSFEQLRLEFVLISGALLTLVVKAKSISSEVLGLLSGNLQTKLRDVGIEGFFVNFNPAAGQRVLSSSGWSRIWGEELARDTSNWIYGPDSFRQLIASLHDDALREAREFLDPRKGDSLLDLYSGSGWTLKLWEERGSRCLGVELGGEAVRCADLNLEPGQVLRGKASERIPQLEKWMTEGGATRRLLFANPPRTGLESEVVSWIAEVFRPERIAYLSCSAGTLARDLSVLANKGYALCRVTPYDFFPQTHHVEVIALLERTA